jgi:hypothetical protein
MYICTYCLVASTVIRRFTTPAFEIARTMKEGDNSYLIVIDAVQQSISENKQFADRGIADFRDDSTTLTEPGQPGGDSIAAFTR